MSDMMTLEQCQFMWKAIGATDDQVKVMTKVMIRHKELRNNGMSEEVADKIITQELGDEIKKAGPLKPQLSEVT